MTCGAETTLRQPAATPRCTGRRPASRSVRATAAASSIAAWSPALPGGPDGSQAAQVVLGEEVGGQVTGQEGRVSQHLDEQVAVGAQAVQPGPAQRPGQSPRGLGPGRAPRRSPSRASRRSASRPRCRSRSRSPAAARRRSAHRTRRPRRGSRSCASTPALRLVVGGRVLGVQPDLDGVTPRLGRRRRHRPALGDARAAARPGRARRRPRSPGARPAAGCSSPGTRPARPPSPVEAVASAEPVATMNSTVPAPTYPIASAARRAASCRVRRTSSDRPGAGASSTTFWWRRCTEQSRSPSTSTPPCRSPTTCTSTCRPCSR